MALVRNDYCPSCYAKQGHEHASQCPLADDDLPGSVYNYPTTPPFGSALGSVVGAPKHPWPEGGLEASEPEDPTAYRVRPFYVSGEVAGRPVRLRLHPEPGMTPDEWMLLWPLLNDRVRGNRMFYVLDNKLIRHFVEEPETEEDKLVKDAVGRLARAKYGASLMSPDEEPVSMGVVRARLDAQLAAAAQVPARLLGDRLVNPPLDRDREAKGLSMQTLREAIALVPIFGKRK
jgi:hypothetical protein